MEDRIEKEEEECKIDEEENAEDEEEEEIENRCVKLRKSRYPNRPTTIVFDYPKEIQVNERKEDESIDRIQVIATPPCNNSRHLLYKTYWERNSVKNAFKKAGFERTKGSKWSAAWVKHMQKQEYANLAPYQRINHFPDSWVIGRKDRLMRCLSAMQRQFGLPYNFVPTGYSLPDQKDAFLRAVAREPKALWILKPPASACGRGIRVIHSNNLKTIPANKKRIIQRYISNPCLIDERKFDLRLYVLVTSIYPLRIYLFHEGLVRFCTAKYSTKAADLKNRFGHLTNYSVNCKSDEFQQNLQQETDGHGSKWSLRALFDRLEADGVTEDARESIMKPIQDIVIKTMIGAEGHITPLVDQYVPDRNNCYELYGFDFMLDATLKPWLIEVNISPSLMGSSPLDRRIKGLLMADIFNLVGFQFPSVSPSNAIPKQLKLKKLKKRFMKKKSKRINSFRNSTEKSFSTTIDTEFTPAQIKLLNSSDWSVILDYEEESERTGHFDCIFPTNETHQRYQRFFSAPRYFNILTGRWLQYKKKNQLVYLPNQSADMPSSWVAPNNKISLIKRFTSKQRVGITNNL